MHLDSLFKRCDYCQTPRWLHWLDHPFDSPTDETWEQDAWDVCWDDVEFDDKGEWVLRDSKPQNDKTRDAQTH